jgi:uncharacterized membrane protein
MFILLILLVVILYFLFRKEEPVIKERKESALDILKIRYAKGLISREEYFEMKETLSKE